MHRKPLSQVLNRNVALQEVVSKGTTRGTKKLASPAVNIDPLPGGSFLACRGASHLSARTVEASPRPLLVERVVILVRSQSSLRHG